MRFAFYGRVSTEDQQDPKSSRQWQLSRASAILPSGGKVVAEFFDIGQSRSLPWKRRPEAARLLDALRNPARGFGAVVIGEPARAFYGAQFQNTFPLFVHYDVQLWVPDVGGYVDPDSDGAEMMMAIYGTMSTQERRRIKIRVRTAMQAQAQHEGRFLGGRPPYGYQLADAGPHPNPGKAAAGQRMHRLEPDPITAPTVLRIFEGYVGGKGIGRIAEELNRDGIPSPSAYDPTRNRHRAGSGGAWAKSAVRAILMNPRYGGREVWNKQGRHEELVDVDDVAAGHVTRQRWNDRADWIWSSEETHPAIISPELFAQAEAQRAAGAPRVVVPRRKHDYCLSSLIHCGSCGRRMTGSWNHDSAWYRCKYPSEYAGATGRHPKVVYVRQAQVLPALDGWLLKHFDPENTEATVAALTAAQRPDEAVAARVEAAQRSVLDCDKKLLKYRAALEAGADPVIVAGWIREVEAARLLAESELAQAAPSQPFSAGEVRALVEAVRENLIGLDGATAEQRAALYRAMGLRLTYHPDRAVLEIEARPACTPERVGGGT